MTSAGVPLVVGMFSMEPADDGLGWLQTMLAGAFPIWGLALAAATLAYHLRRRGACDTCHRA